MDVSADCVAMTASSPNPAPSTEPGGQPREGVPVGDHHGLEELIGHDPTPVPTHRRIWLLVLGIALLVIGTVVWILPIVFGAPIFWLAGLLCLAKVSDRARRAINYGDRQLPKRVRHGLRWARDKTNGQQPAARKATPAPDEPRS